MTFAPYGSAGQVRGPSSFRGNVVVAVLLFVFLFVAYQSNGTVIPEGDAVPSENIPIALLLNKKLSFSTDDFPEMFKWKSQRPLFPKDDFFLMSWKDRFGDQSAEDWRFSGHLEFNGPRYYVVNSPMGHGFVSTFGPIPGIVLFPVLAPFYMRDHDIGSKLIARATIGKLCASILVAMTGVLIFLIASRWLSRGRAILIALIYGLGTCAWAVSSQAIWQQTVDQLFLTAGALFVLRSIERRGMAFFAGLALGAAVACRATGLIVLLAVLIDLAWNHRDRIPLFLLGVLPVPLAVAAYNWHFFGGPFSFAQELVGHSVAFEKTGSRELWQTPLWKGALGLLVSPSRGMLVFSPVLGVAFWGIYRAFKGADYRALQPFAVGSLLIMGIQCKWFDWWGGHAYGYRPWLDVVPYLVLMFIPVVDSILSSTTRKSIFGVAIAWSVFVQALGAMSYDRSWNLRQVFVVRTPDSNEPEALLSEAEASRFADEHHGTYLGPSFCDIDLSFCRKRLWSIRDSLILYQITDFSRTRSERLRATFSEPTRWE